MSQTMVRTRTGWKAASVVPVPILVAVGKDATTDRKHRWMVDAEEEEQAVKLRDLGGRAGDAPEPGVAAPAQSLPSRRGHRCCPLGTKPRGEAGHRSSGEVPDGGEARGERTTVQELPERVGHDGFNTGIKRNARPNREMRGPATRKTFPGRPRHGSCGLRSPWTP